jgi:ornithine--oxo-acid transaminase
MTHDLSWGRRYLMCPPAHFEISYAINPWMDTAVAVDGARAQRQWDALVQTLRDAGAEVEELTPHPSLPDLVFTANLGLIDDDTFIAARMRHPERREEAAHAEAWFREHGYGVRHLGDDVVHEGAGDGLPFEGTLVGGYRTRSSASSYVDLARLTDARIVPVELVDERFYHVDIVFCPLDARSALLAPTKLDADGARRIEQLVPDPILLTDEEAEQFSANSVVVGRTVVMPACSPRLEGELRARGFDPVVVDVSEFLKAGGGPRCLTLALDVALSHPDTAALADRFTAHNYHPLPITVSHAEGSWVHDDRGRRFLDALSAYSALNFGHRHPRLVAAAQEQLGRVTLTSRAFGNDQLGPFARDLSALTGKDRILPMNTGAEAVETAIKTARKWGYDVKGVAPGRATIIVCDGNFHGRTTTIVSFSDDPVARDGFGPFTPGFVAIPYGDAAALEAAITPNTAAFLVEPVQGEGGIIVPPDGYLAQCARICRDRRVLLICDEIQTGLGRTGYRLACEHDGVRPDGVILGKALGGGLLPVSMFAATDDVMQVFSPGDHGSTFGGNPLASAVAIAALDVLERENLCERSAKLGAWLLSELRKMGSPLITDVRGRGLFIGIEVDASRVTARAVVDRLLARGLLSKDTHGTVVRIAPPLVIAREDLAWAVEEIAATFRDLEKIETAA